MKTHLVSFATGDFRICQRELILSARSYGINSFFTYKENDLRCSSFYRENIDIFKYKRGLGFWLWKPFFILRALENIKEGDVLIYADSGCLFIDSPTKLIELCIGSSCGILAFDAFPLKNRQFVKRDTFINLNCDSDLYWNANHVIATVILVRKCDFTRKFLTEWLDACKNFNSISDVENIHGLDNFPEFRTNQGDQSIFSILISKYHLTTYRNPSKWGNFLKLPEYRVQDEVVCYPYYIDNTLDDYSSTPYYNSPYPTIFEFNRCSNLKNTSFLSRVLRKFKSYSTQ